MLVVASDSFTEFLSDSVQVVFLVKRWAGRKDTFLEVEKRGTVHIFHG
jgi:hypothetical protein